jgi:hypothetical protein
MSSLSLQIAPVHRIDEHMNRGVIQITAQGFFDVETLRIHFDELEYILRKWRMLGKPIRVLVDAVNLLPYAPAVQTVFHESIQRVYAPGDRVAVLVASNLMKMQVRRALNQGELNAYFVSSTAAMTWLMAHEPAHTTHAQRL